MGPAHDTSGAPICSEISSTFAWGRRVPVSAVYHEEVVLESCLWRGYVPAGETYALGSLFTPRSYLASVVDSEGMKQELHTAHYTTALGASQRPVLTHHNTLGPTHTSLLCVPHMHTCVTHTLHCYVLHTHTNTHTNTQTQMYMHMHNHACMHTHTHTHTHTHPHFV